MLHLTDSQNHELLDALHYLKVMELRAFCDRCGLSSKGNKAVLIHRIIVFVTTGEVLVPPVIPHISRAERSKHYKLAPQELMLYGAYKNDAKARGFFKALIGDHFHFTAYGIDWLNERWHEGNPPTYSEFAAEWQAEYERNKVQKREPKKEWAYINFTQNFLHQNPTASKKAILDAWQQERRFKVALVNNLLRLKDRLKK